MYAFLSNLLRLWLDFKLVEQLLDLLLVKKLVAFMYTAKFVMSPTHVKQDSLEKINKIIVIKKIFSYEKM